MKPISSRRVLHQPLVPIQWSTPPPPPPLFFPDPISTTSTTAAAYSPPSTHHHDSTSKIVTIVASISIGAFFFLSILFMFFHQKGIQNHHRNNDVPVKRGAGGQEIAAAAAGDEESEVGSSTAGNKTVQMELLIHHPISPEIKPLPPLLPEAAQRSVSRPSPEISPLTPPLTRQDQQHVQFFMGKATLERSYSWSGTTRFSVGSSPNLQPQSPLPELTQPADLNDSFGVDFAGKGTGIMNSSESVNVWGRFKSRSLRLDDDMIEISTTSFGKDRVLSLKKNRVLDAEKAESIEILLRTSTVKTEDLCEALLDGGSEFLGTEFLDSLIKLAPTKEEEFLLRHFRGEVTWLNAAERFLKAVLDVPFAMKRIEVMLYQARFETNIDYLKNSFQTLQDACQDLRRNKLFLKLLEAANSTRNQLGTETQEYTKASGLDSLLQLCDAKEEGGKPTPLHYAVEDLISNEKLHSDIIREEECKRQGLKIMAGLSAEFENVKKAAEMDLQTLRDHVKKQDLGLEKVKWLLQLDKACNVGESFFKKMKKFAIEAEVEIEDVKEQVEVTSRCIRETTEHFNLAKDAGNPLRILTLVRDFLLVLDGVCKDIRRMHDKAMFGSLSGRILHFSPVPSAVT